MWGRGIAVVVGFGCLILPASASAQGALAFTSLRCDDGGQPPRAAPGAAPGACAAGIFVMNDDGSGARRLTNGSSAGEPAETGDFMPSWSPDGRRIVFARHTQEADHGRILLFTMNADGSDQRRLTTRDTRYFDEKDPAWSPRGDAIAFSMPDPEAGCFHNGTWLVNPDGSGLRMLEPRGHVKFSPTFTPDGRRVLYFGGPGLPGPCKVGQSPSAAEYGIWSVNVDGSDPQRLMLGDIQPAGNGFSIAPDGRRLAVTLSDGSLYTVRTDGSELTRLTTGVARRPVWSGLGNAIFFNGGGATDGVAIYRAPIPPLAPPAPITTPGAGDHEPAWSLAGRATSALPLDELPPVTLLGERLESPPPATSRIPFMVVDRTGIRRVEAAVGLRVKGGCRFAGAGRLGARRACTRPTYTRVKTLAGWRALTKRLPKGRYEVRFRTTDVRGNTTKRPKPRVVKVG